MVVVVDDDDASGRLGGIEPQRGSPLATGEKVRAGRDGEGWGAVAVVVDDGDDDGEVDGGCPAGEGDGGGVGGC